MPEKRPLRSMLWVPGNRESWIPRAAASGADALILDLEDSVPYSEKLAAREIVARYLNTDTATDPAIFVRVNELGGGLIEDDIEAIVSRRLYGILVPKVYGPEDIVTVDTLLGHYERCAGLEPGQTVIKPGIETARGIREAYQIGRASPRVAHIGAGHMKGGDAARALGFQWTRDGKETFYMRAKVLLDARAAGDPYPCADPWSDIGDLEGLRAYLVEMRQLGYTGFTPLHPSHVPIANEVFTPTPDEIAGWQGLVREMDEARKQGRAAVVYQDQMIDIAMEKTARDMLDLARKLGLSVD